MSSSSDTIMNPAVWDHLQYHISLSEDVYLKLPLHPFFKLRGVCKEWNTLARQRRCLTDPIHKPYFVLINPELVHSETDDHGTKTQRHLTPCPRSILTYHIASGHWKWSPLCVVSNQANPLYEPFSVKGFIFDRDDQSPTPWAHLFNVHTRSFCWPSPAPPMTGRASALGIAVDTSAVPYTYKIILGGSYTRTQVYDSFTSTWKMRSSMLPPCWPIAGLAHCSKSCLHCNDHVYISSRMAESILVYSLKDDVWSKLEYPPQQYENDRAGGALGFWDGRVFIVREPVREKIGLSLWELVDHSAQVWRKIAHMPPEMHAWLESEVGDGAQVSASFCDEHVLMCRMLSNGTKLYTRQPIVLFNLATKCWEKTDFVE